jgi:predicted enzyme related to lactoylglutathione lyase
VYGGELSAMRRVFAFSSYFDILNIQVHAKGSLNETERKMQVHYLEIVTSEVDATCAAQEKLHGVTFGEAEASLGGARTAALPGGSRIGIRAPMHESETPVVRPYVLVDDIEAAANAAVEAGGEIAHPPMEIPGQGKFAIYLQGGIQHGLWQV